MTVKIPYAFGDSIYIKTDPEQKEYTFVGFIGRPGSILYTLDYLGDEIEVYDFQTSRDRDILKATGADKADQEDTD